MFHLKYTLWFPAVDYENNIIDGYFVSSDGFVKSVDRQIKGKHGFPSFKKGRILSPYTKKGTNYKRVSLYINGKNKKFYVHDLVALSFPYFCGKYFNGATVDHKNGKQDDNRAENLWWCTQKENVHNPITYKKQIIASIKNLEKANTAEAKNKARNKKFKKVFCNENNKIYNSRFDAAKDLNVNPDCVWRCCAGKQTTTNGFTFKFI